MSADNWTACPKCTDPEEWSDIEHNEAGEFREDYEIGIHNGKFFIDYHGQCQNEQCGYTKTFKTEEIITEVPEQNENNLSQNN